MKSTTYWEVSEKKLEVKSEVRRAGFFICHFQLFSLFDLSLCLRHSLCLCGSRVLLHEIHQEDTEKDGDKEISQGSEVQKSELSHPTRLATSA